MKKFLILLFFCLLFSSGLMAQTRTRKIPFLPYAGVASDNKDVIKTVGMGEASSAAPTISQTKTIFFDKDSSDIREDQRKKLLEIGKWLEREGGAFYHVRIFTSPEISSSLAQRRGTVVIEALSDFKVGRPILQYEYRKSPVINPNRVEVLQ